MNTPRKPPAENPRDPEPGNNPAQNPRDPGVVNPENEPQPNQPPGINPNV